MTEDQKPQINDILKIICAGSDGVDEEIISRLEGYQSNDSGEYIKLKGHQAIFAQSIKKLEVLNDK